MGGTVGQLTCGKCGAKLGAMYYSSVADYGFVCTACHDELYPTGIQTITIEGVVSVPETPAPPDPSADRFAALEARVAELERQLEPGECIGTLASLREEFNKHSAPIGPGPCSPHGCRCVLGPNSPIQPQCDNRGPGADIVIKAE